MTYGKYRNSFVIIPERDGKVDGRTDQNTAGHRDFFKPGDERGWLKNWFKGHQTTGRKKQHIFVVLLFTVVCLHLKPARISVVQLTRNVRMLLLSNTLTNTETFSLSFYDMRMLLSSCWYCCVILWRTEKVKSP